MKTKSFKRVLALVIATAMALTACGQKDDTNDNDSGSSEISTEVGGEESTPEQEDLPVITLYPSNADLFSGSVTGHKADYFAENGFELEVWSFSEDKTTAILSSGDLPDMMYIGSGGVETLETLIETDKIINYEDYKEYLPNYFGEDAPNQYIADNFDVIRENFSAGTNGLYVLPFGVGQNYSYYSACGAFEPNVVKLNWELYEAIGAPEITDMWHLLDVAEEMLAYRPETEDGLKLQGMYLDNSSDYASWGCMNMWYAWHGYNPWIYKFFGEVDMVNGTVESIFEDDSLYKEGAKWYNAAYRRGLMDPDSISTPMTDQYPKVDAGLGVVPSGTTPGWKPYYYEYVVPGTTVYKDFATETMGAVTNCIVISAETEHLEECLAFVNMLADPYSWLRINYGPEGDIWECDGNVLSITDRFAEYVEEYGGINFYPMSDGTEWNSWNIGTAHGSGTPIPGFVDTEGKEVCAEVLTWPDVEAFSDNNDNWNAWKETMDALDLVDYCEKNDITIHTSSPFDGVLWPVADDDQTLTMNVLKDLVVTETWKMVYAESDEEFEQIWDNMVANAMELGAQEIVDWFKASYQPLY